MTDLDDDLKSTAQAIIEDAEHIQDIEQGKLELDAAGPRAAAFAKEAEAVAMAPSAARGPST